MDNLESVLHEDRVFPPNPEFAAHARIGSREAYDALCAEAEKDYEGYWARLAREEITWQTPFTQILDESNAPHYRWFADGTLNVSVNCIDRHLNSKGDKVAFIVEHDDGETRTITYRQLSEQVNRLANGLKELGIKTGDRVVIYMPMLPEAVIAMLACARIGAIHSVVFAGFSAEALRDRVLDTGAKLIITADGGMRGGRMVPLKASVDKAMQHGCPDVKNVLVFKRTGSEITMHAGRDIWWHELVEKQSADCEPVYVNAEHPLFLLYTSGSTG
ncbi:MAG TPA: acetyl-coenzyme A synthetase, partial [Halothiobacillus sp.]|nr:acetyl-coenzyme A synthetase [Halothiobacillus sp.]